MSNVLQERIEHFQSYILRAYMDKDRHWERTRDLIFAVADAIIDSFKPLKIPINPLSACEILGIEVELCRKRNPVALAELLPEKSGLILRLYGMNLHHSDYSGHVNLSVRDRFSVAHECGHSLFYLKDTQPAKRLIPRGSDYRSIQFRREEGLCNAFAGALLIPASYREGIDKVIPSCKKLLQISNRFKTSGEATIRRIQYDFELWKDNIFFRLESSRSGTRLDGPYRGKNRRGNNADIPSRIQIQSVIESTRLSNALAKLKDILSIPILDVHKGTRTVWIML
jgi:Zn-dependent peptidase ImmA (M78 family)